MSTKEHSADEECEFYKNALHRTMENPEAAKENYFGAGSDAYSQASHESHLGSGTTMLCDWHQRYKIIFYRGGTSKSACDLTSEEEISYPANVSVLEWDQNIEAFCETKNTSLPAMIFHVYVEQEPPLRDKLQQGYETTTSGTLGTSGTSPMRVSTGLVANSDSERDRGLSRSGQGRASGNQPSISVTSSALARIHDFFWRPE